MISESARPMSSKTAQTVHQNQLFPAFFKQFLILIGIGRAAGFAGQRRIR